MNPKLIAGLVAALILAALVAWGFKERSARLAAEKDLETWKGAVQVRDERIQELGRSVLALENAAKAARAEAASLRARRAKDNAALLDEIARLGGALKGKTPEGAGCHEAIQNWRAGK
jgi:hypothetical protein